MKKLNVIILFMVVLLASCTKKVGMTSSKIKLFGSNAFSTGSTLETLANNGLIFYGTSTDGKTFSKRIDTDTADLVFPNGTWSFFAVAWEQASATSPFQGKVRCAKQLGVVLNGSDTTISLTLDNAKCADSAFTANSYNTGTQVLLPQRNFIGCKDQTLATNYSDTAACTLNSQASNNKGYATSYRVYIPQYKNFGNGLEEYNDAFKSACVTLNPNSTISTADSASMSLLGSMSFPDPVNGLGIMLRLYYSQNACDDSTGFDDVVIGSNDTPRTKSFIYATGQAINRTFYSTPESEVCKGPRLTTANVYAGGVGLNYSPSYICTAEQFNNISQNYGSGSEAQSFMLMRDIDFGFGAFNPIGHTIDATYSYESTPYTGIFYGNNKTLSNIFIRNANSISSGGYIGVFRKVGTPPISIDHIANLTINRAAIIGFEKFNRVGLLAGFMQDSSVSNIKLFGHAEGSGVVGGMVGELSSSSTTIAINDVAAEVDVKGKIDVIDGNNNGVGGLVGYKSGSTAANFNRIAVKPQIHNDGGEYYVDVPIALYTGLTTGTQYCLDSTCTSGYFSVNEKITTSASTYLIKISGNNNLNFTAGTVYSTGGVYIGTSNSAVKIAGIGGLVGYIGGSATSLIDNVIVKSAEIDGPKWIGGIVGSVGTQTMIANTKFEGSIRANNWGESVSSTGVGGIMGQGTSGSNISTSIVVGSITGPSGDSTSTGALIGTQLGTSLTNNYYTMTNINAAGGSTSPSTRAVLSSKANYSTFTFVDYIFAESPTVHIFGSAPTTGQMYFDTSAKLCYAYSASSWSLANSGLPYCANYWFMHADGYDLPRLAIEVAMQEQVPFLKTSCANSTYYQGTPLQAADGGRIICTPSQISSTSTIAPQDHLGQSLYFDVGTSTAYAAGVYKINGHNFSLYNWNNNSGESVFAALNSSSYLSNIKLKGAHVGSDGSAGNFYGLIARMNVGTIENLRITDAQISLPDVSGLTDSSAISNFYIGGVVAKNMGTIIGGELETSIIMAGENSSAIPYSVGGVAGYNSGSIKQVQVHSNVSRSGATYLANVEAYGALAGRSNGGLFDQFDVDGHIQLNASSANGSTMVQVGPVIGEVISGTTATISNFVVSSDVNYNNVNLNSLLYLQQGSGSSLISRGFYYLYNQTQLNLLTSAPALTNGTANVVYISKQNSPPTVNNILYNTNFTVSGTTAGLSGTISNGSSSTVNLDFSGWNYITSFIQSMGSSSSYVWRIDPLMGGEMELVKASGDFDRIGAGF